MKKYYLILIIACLITSIVGFFVGKLIYHQPSKELCLGPPNGRGAIYYGKFINDLDPEDKLDIDDL